MAKDWGELTRLTHGARLTVERVRLADEDIAIEGSFELPLLASLTADDQAFVASFVRCHGSIKQMEQWFGVSYPTVKNRLNRIGEALGFVDANPPDAPTDVLGRLERGEISVEQALEALNR